MSIVVWDGKTLASDRGASDGPTIWEVTKLRTFKDFALVGVGPSLEVGRLTDWYLNGSHTDKFPYTGAGAKLLVCRNKKLFEYSNSSLPNIFDEHHKVAFGSGKDFAFGALAMGATAEQAVHIACRYSTSCGHGVDTYEAVE